jgi:AraC-like DNA-binding protein
MHTLQVCRPRPELRPYVRTFVQRKIGSASAVVIEPTTAQLEQILAFDFGTPVECWWPNGKIEVVDTATVAGAQTQFACHMHLRAGVESFGIFFQPTGLTFLFGIPICELTNHHVDATALIGWPIRRLWNQLGESSSFEDRVVIAEDFLVHETARARSYDTIAAAVNYIFRSYGAVRITDVSGRMSTGLRQFERKFREEVGTSPKVFARIARFQAALDAKIAAPKRTWLDIAHAFGYHDQMHMIHDFNTLGRSCPGSLVQQIGDSRPPALAANEHADTAAFPIGSH